MLINFQAAPGSNQRQTFFSDPFYFGVAACQMRANGPINGALSRGILCHFFQRSIVKSVNKEKTAEMIGEGGENIIAALTYYGIEVITWQFGLRGLFGMTRCCLS